MLSRIVRLSLPLVVALPLASGCQSTYYAAWEKLGYEKRDILTSRVEKARDAQQDAKEEVVSALEAFSKTVKYDGGELQAQYKRLSAQLESSEDAAANVRTRVANVEKVAGALFDEWKSELDNYQNPALRQRSQQQLAETRSRYGQMIRAMRAARDRLEPALSPLRDQVLFLKHNLNARALATIKDEVAKVDVEVDRLVADIDKAIAEANRFIKQL